MIRSTRTRVLVASLCFWFACCSYARAADHPPQVNVILWFDTEDYLSPSDDDADKRLAELLTERHVRATFKVVGEKARVLEQHGRKDVIEALRPHDIGFHANFHSVHPTVTEYEADCGLLDGIAEFVRREGPGAADVRRIFNRKSLVCYGQPGSSWASQAIAALGQCGIENNGVPCYVDSGNHVGFGGIPFWYAGALVVYKMQPNETRMELFSPGGLEKGKKDVSEIAARLYHQGGGLISIFYHPCEWVTSEFWDAPNFSRGNNPPREQWKRPTQRTREEAEQAFARFSAYIDHIHSLPGVQFVTASQLPQLYPDHARSEGVSAEEITTLATSMQRPDFAGLDDMEIHGKMLSPADQFDILTRAVAQRIEQRGEASRDGSITPANLLGPDAAAKESTVAPPVSWPAFRDAVLDARDELRVNHRIPSRVFIGTEAASPGDFLVGLSAAWLGLQRAQHFPESVTLGHNVELLTARRVAKDEPKLFGGWVIHKEGFRAPKVMEIARLQAWTLKPATLAQ